MTHSLPASALALALILPAAGCGNGNSAGREATPGDMTILSISVSEGDIWPVNRPIDITFDRDLDFDTVGLNTLRVLDSSGQPAIGVYSQPADSDGLALPAAVRFQPACPTQPGGSDAGFTPGGTQYRLSISGADAGGVAILSANGEPLGQSLEVAFTTPIATDPAQLFFDPVPGPPGLRIRGRNGVSPLEFDATHVEVGLAPGGRAYFLWNPPAPYAELDPAYASFLPDGLPLNHYSVPDHHVAFAVSFDQPVSPADANVQRVGVEYLDGDWKPLAGEAELVSNCEETGAFVRFVPEGLLPRATTLRVVVAAGFADLTGEALIFPDAGLVRVTTAAGGQGAGARADEYFESFTVGGDAPGSLEDTEAVFDVPRALWGNGFLAPAFGPGPDSRARSKWVPLGLALLDPGGPDVTPRFVFSGTDDSGAVETTDGFVDSVPAVIGPELLIMPPGMPRIHPPEGAILFELASLTPQDDIYLANPGLLRGFRTRLSMLAGGRDPLVAGSPLLVHGARALAGVLTVDFGYEYSPGFDALPFDYYGLAAEVDLMVEFVPRSFRVVAGPAHLNWIPPDARVSILFDATVADGLGDPDPDQALSAQGGWRPDIADLSGGAWDFIRFEVRFELDVSGDGWSELTRPGLDFVRMPFDLRPL